MDQLDEIKVVEGLGKAVYLTCGGAVRAWGEEAGPDLGITEGHCVLLLSRTIDVQSVDCGMLT